MARKILHLMRQIHLAMSFRHSSAALSQRIWHELAILLPHVLRYPKMSAHNLQSCLHRSDLHNLVKISPHTIRYRISPHQQNNMYLPWVITPWQTAFLPSTVRPRTFCRDIPHLHRSGPHGAVKSLPHAFLTSYDIIQTIFSRKYPCEIHILVKIMPHVLKHPKMFVPQSAILPTPKCTTQPGMSFTLMHQRILDFYLQS
jgi:hypothetical protein